MKTNTYARAVAAFEGFLAVVEQGLADGEINTDEVAELDLSLLGRVPAEHLAAEFVDVICEDVDNV